MRLVAVQEFPYGGRNLKPGDPFEASDEDARILKGVGKARGEGEEKSQEKTDVTEPRKKRTYKRRDLRAEDSNGGQT